MFDLILKGGEVFDGSGNESIVGDIAIKDGIISAVEPAGILKTSNAESVGGSKRKRWKGRPG